MSTGHVRRARVPHAVRWGAALSVLASLPFLFLAVVWFGTALEIGPPLQPGSPPPSDFLPLAVLASIPGLLALTTGLTAGRMWRRGHRDRVIALFIVVVSTGGFLAAMYALSWMAA